MKQQLQQLFSEVLTDMGVTGVDVEIVQSPDPEHGEYSTNVAMRIAKELKKPPMDIALQVKEVISEQKTENRHKSGNQKIGKQDQKESGKKTGKNKLQVSKLSETEKWQVLSAIDRVEIVSPGFINMFLKESFLSSQIEEVLKVQEAYGKRFRQSPMPLNLDESVKTGSKRIMVEFAHPNTHKAFHIGHLRNITTGESIIRLLEATGHEMIRANYQGDVGMHIAKCLWAMKNLPEFDPADVRNKDIHERVAFLGKAYASGSARFEEEDAVKQEVATMNKQIYAKDEAIYSLYQETRQWSLDYFDAIYRRVGTHYDRLYFESETYESGKQYVLEGLKKGIFKYSDGAIVFPGEKYGLHTRVFVTKEGNATYEGKDMGLAPLQHAEYHPDLILHVLGPEQYDYTRVMFKALDLLFPKTANRQFHKTYGWVKLKHGKMSSRTGQVVLGEWLLDEAKKSIYEILDKNRSDYSQEQKDEIAEKAAVAAVKYAFLKVSTNQEIAFDLKESVAFDGDSGPYLLYSYSRAKSVIRKAGQLSDLDLSQLSDVRTLSNLGMNLEEKQIARLIAFYPDIVAEAGANLAPNTLAAFLFRLAQAYNVFYQKHPILGVNASKVSKRQTDPSADTLTHRHIDPIAHRLALTAATARVLHNGLYLLGIDTVERM